MSRATQDYRLRATPSRKGLSPATAALSNAVPVDFAQITLILLPLQCRNFAGLGCSAFARHYLRNHSYFLFLRVLRCFSSPRSPPHKAGIPEPRHPPSALLLSFLYLFWKNMILQNHDFPLDLLLFCNMSKNVWT